MRGGREGEIWKKIQQKTNKKARKVGSQEMVVVQKPTDQEAFQREENDQQPNAAVRTSEMKMGRVSDQWTEQCRGQW